MQEIRAAVREEGDDREGTGRGGADRRMYRRVVFKSASVVALVLNGQRTAKFMMDGRHLWAPMYLPWRLASNTKMAPAL
ncbi:hypothetical protein KSP40_PGU000635 [Platanthera guangdongensis]|uniref:Uncharacterized protein n=1 Tax=Platanthera guangdongensis TaxID=2320717 RepID=A0ABR2MIU8_9ASPA